MEGHDPGVGVEHGEGGAPVAIAGLTDGAGIDEIAAILAEGPVGGLGLAHGAISGTVGFADRAREHETALQVSVSEERDGGGIGDEWFDGVAGADRVFIFVERGAVDELDAGEFVEMDGTLRQRAEPFEIFRVSWSRVQRVARPATMVDDILVFGGAESPGLRARSASTCTCNREREK